jgi:hypothetical protein
VANALPARTTLRWALAEVSCFLLTFVQPHSDAAVTCSMLCHQQQALQRLTRDGDCVEDALEATRGVQAVLVVVQQRTASPAAAGRRQQRRLKRALLQQPTAQYVWGTSRESLTAAIAKTSI